MPRTITVEVTRADIEAGVRNDCYACPVALAIARLVGVDRCVSVGFSDTWILAHRMATSAVVRDFISRFDAGQDGLEPFSFEIDIPDRFPLVESPR